MGEGLLKAAAEEEDFSSCLELLVCLVLLSDAPGLQEPERKSDQRSDGASATGPGILGRQQPQT